ncbi:MAG: exonuclease [Chloroflexi bacterium]|nr:exonuclease [Chloroflexota bacterium]
MVEIYVSTDVEADGPIPGPHSMLSFASAAFLADKTLVGTFTANLELLPGAEPHPKTNEFWQEHQEAWLASRRDLQDPAAAMHQYVAWLESLPGQPVFVAYPVGYDFAFIYWYLMRFVGASPFGHAGIDIATYAMAMLNRSYKESGKSGMPRRWFDDHPHTHKPLDDAIEQGTLFCNMLAENSRRGSHAPPTVWAGPVSW